jgi:hypothetical protein
MVRSGKGFWLHYKARNTANNAPALNDAANHTLKLFIDGILLDPTNAPEDIAVGECRIFITPSESDGAKFIAVDGTSSTADVSLIRGMVITDLLKPGVGFVGCFTCWDAENNQPALGEDDVSLSMIIAQNNTSGAAINSPVELGALTVPGLYAISVTSSENPGTALSILGESNTVGVEIMPTEMGPHNEDQAAEADVRIDIDYAEGTLTGTLSPFSCTYELPQEVIIEDEEIIIEGCD